MSQQYGNWSGQQQTVGHITIPNSGEYNHYGQFHQGMKASGLQAETFRQIMADQQQEQKLSGNKPIVVCAGCVQEADDMDKAQALAESLAHSKSADAYILKPVKKVAPKRDVVTTDLP